MKNKILKYNWRKWLERPFYGFIMSVFSGGMGPDYFAKLGFKNSKNFCFLFQNGLWYEDKKMYEASNASVKDFVKNHSVFEITKSLDKFHAQSIKKIKDLIQKNNDPIDSLKIVADLLYLSTTYIWLSHRLEYEFEQELHKIAPKYIKNDVEKFIGDASFPKKKNIHVFMEEEMRKGTDPKQIALEFGWLRARDGFSEPFTQEDIQEQIQNLKPALTHPNVKIPKPLEPIFNEAQELVYFRTARTDVFYHLLFLARPILKNVADHYHIPFTELKYYSIQSLIKGSPKKYTPIYTYANCDGEEYFSQEPLIKEKQVESQQEIKGNVAYAGKVRGIVKIVKDVSDSGKVEEGNILVTQMTSPNLLMAMRKAAAFVTDEGGLTCHAAIIAREMQKPCITGTRIATEVLKDGDLVEVDADKGVIRKINE